MKTQKFYILILFFVFNYLFLVRPMLAVSPTPSKTITPTTDPATDSTISNQAKELQERLASKVAELKLVDRRGIIGAVTESSSTQLTLTDVSGNTRFVDVDELTKFSSDSAKQSFGISDVSKGQQLGILGLYNKQSKRIMARFVDASLSFPTIVHGAVTSVDKDNYAFIAATADDNKYTFDVENITKTQSFTKDAGLARAGFTKIKTGEHIIVVGFRNTKDKTRYIASRVLLFPEIPPDPKISISASPQEAIVPSTGSGKKLTPITR